MTVRVSALPKGTPPRAADSPRASARAHARTRITDRDSPVQSWPRKCGHTIRDDLVGSWMLADSTPTIRVYLAAERARPAPYGSTPLRRARLVWAYTLGIAGTITGHTLAWIFQSPVRLLTAVVTVGGPILIWRLGGG